MTIKNKEAWAKAALFAAALIWGLSFVILKDAITELPPLFTIAVRFLIAFILLSAVFLKKYSLINREYIFHCIICGILLGIAYAVQTLGLEGTTPGKNAFLTSGYCIITPFLYWLISHKRPTVYNVSAAFVCMIGFGLISLDGNIGISKGDFMSILCGFFYALHIAYTAKIYGRKDPVMFSLLQFATAAVSCFIYSLLSEDIPRTIPLSVVPEILFLSVVATALGLLFQTIGQKYANPSAAALILSLESVFGVAFSLVFYTEEKLTLRLAAGFAFIFAAIIISEVLGRKKNFSIQKGTEVTL